MSERDEPVSGATNAGEAPLIRDDGSKVATAGSPSGETETEKVRREESRLPNRGVSPDYTDPHDEEDGALADRPPQNEHDETLIADEFKGLDNDLVNVGEFSDPASGSEGGRPLPSVERDVGQPGAPRRP